MMTSTNDNKKSSEDSAASARPHKFAGEEEMEHNIANIIWIADTEVRAQMQTEVAAESCHTRCTHTTEREPAGAATCGASGARAPRPRAALHWHGK